MQIDIAYVYPAIVSRTYRPMAARFVRTYMQFPPGGEDHKITALINGGAAAHVRNYSSIFRPLDCGIFFHNNVGKDIGAFQSFASTLKSDLLICLGSPVHFRRTGWLDRIVQAYEQNGPGIYGAWAFQEPRDHIRTTAFWLPPQLLNAYPFQIMNENRYEFEHGHNSICNFVKSLGLECYMVSWDGCYPSKDWHHLAVDEMLFLDQHTERIGLG